MTLKNHTNCIKSHRKQKFIKIAVVLFVQKCNYQLTYASSCTESCFLWFTNCDLRFKNGKTNKNTFN